MEPKLDIEKRVAEMAVEKYREWQQKCKDIKKLLSTKEFEYGDYVTRKNDSYFDGVFEVTNIGKVVWFEEEEGYYRVRYDDRNAWVGVREDNLQLYEGEAPRSLVDYDIENETYIGFTVEKMKGAGE